MCFLLQLNAPSRRTASYIQLLWATARLLIARVSLIYLVDEFFIFSFLPSLKEMRTWRESKISSFCFCVWCRSRELRVTESPRFSSVTHVVESFFSDLPQVIISNCAEFHLESCQRSNMERSCEYNQRL